MCKLIEFSSIRFTWRGKKVTGWCFHPNSQIKIAPQKVKMGRKLRVEKIDILIKGSATSTIFL